MGDKHKKHIILTALVFIAGFLAFGFWTEMWGKPTEVRQLPLVDKEFLKTETWRRSYANLVAAKEDLSAFDCYGCHEEGKKLELKYDDKKQVVIPQEHSNIVMGHGTHGRNNNCFNCHNDENLKQLQSRDGKELKFEESTTLCGSCHGPTHRDWEAGSHGRTSGYWNRTREGAEKGEFDGPYVKQDCVNCHDPHSPKFPGRKPAPPPNHLRGETKGTDESASTEH